MNQTTASAPIGPMSILQLIPVIGEMLGNPASSRVLRAAGITQLPTADRLCDEAPAAAVHQALRREFPEVADQITRYAGERTGNWIIATRMPPVAATAMAHMPAWLASPVLCGLIDKHAWSFAGSGQFRVVSRHPVIFELENNPVVRGESAEHVVCSWHSAVFERLFRALVNPQMICVETRCSACGDGVCRFEIH